ncbi:MAG: biotin-independent malonate decarboxylase subunit beta [Inquilinus limosus]|uniref:Biotin-independent malonate decarboxylase subunit beta n=1 Tax=Inquilinus limosus TaxID=171674 RepID=A0A952KJT7_9PROT|nr:biotin-independent malonate decarboxylase subunit beta [Inquilinus limosus]
MNDNAIRQSASQESASWFLASARERLAGLLDPDSFIEILPPSDRVQSPHLALFDLPAAFDDGMIVGRGRLDGREVLVAAQEGQFMGGTFAEVSGAKLVGLLRAARDRADLPVLLLLDSGGVRLQEANAGELAVAEVMRAIAEARSAGVAVIALVGGRSGAFGGAGLTAATCSRIAISEQGRLGVTGPEVIETNQGVEEFDSKDKALVWSVTGGRTRRLIGGADAYAMDTMAGFRGAALALLDRVPAFDLRTLQAEQERLAARQARLGGCSSATEMWAILGIADPEGVRDMDDEAFAALAAKVKGLDHDGR